MMTKEGDFRCIRKLHNLPKYQGLVGLFKIHKYKPVLSGT